MMISHVSPESENSNTRSTHFSRVFRSLYLIVDGTIADSLNDAVINFLSQHAIISPIHTVFMEWLEVNLNRICGLPKGSVLFMLGFSP